MPTLLNTELKQLRERILLMGGKVEDAIKRATDALVERDCELAEQVIGDDDQVDALELEIDWACMRLLALKSPEARDLRMVIAAGKLAMILERIADHACNIARAARSLGAGTPLRDSFELPRMSRIAREMLREALEAFAASDATRAREVIERDSEVDQLYDSIFHDLLDYLSRKSSEVGPAARLLLVTKHLERIGDYVTDICELIVYMKEAIVIRHQRFGRLIPNCAGES